MGKAVWTPAKYFILCPTEERAWVTECLFRFFFSFFGSSSVHQTGNDFRHIISHKRGIWSRSNLCVLVTGESVSPHLGRLFPDPTHNGDLCMHFLFSPTVIDNVMNGFGKEGKALQQNGSLFFLTWMQMSFKKWVLHSFADSCGMDNHWLTARQVSL